MPGTRLRSRSRPERRPVPDSSPDFLWASGIEDTFVPQTRAGHRSLDEYELMGHYDHWREDLALARDLRLNAIRWGVPWYRVEPGPGSFDWSWTDRVIPYLVDELGVTPIIDLMHYGCPLWLEREFAGPDYQRAVAAYATAFARRYHDLVHWYTPLNEPLVNALMCGQRGLWPPYMRGERGYVRVMLQLVNGILETEEQIKEIDPDAVMVHVEAAGLTRAATPELEPLAAEHRARQFLAYDLLTGKVTPDHALYPWLMRCGASHRDLEAIRSRRISPDVMGLNFYPQWSARELYLKRTGTLGNRAAEPDGTGFEEMVRAYFLRYHAPIMITETSVIGNDAARAAWLDISLGAIRRLRSQELPIIGYTWFPMLTMIDWRYRFGARPADAYRIELGLYRLRENPVRRWEPSPLVERWQWHTMHTAEAVGPQPGVQDCLDTTLKRRVTRTDR